MFKFAPRSLALAAMLVSARSHAIGLNDIQLWTGSGSNQAALVIEWSSPESTAYSSVPLPIADKTLVWGYRFNGAATGTQMLDAIATADPKLYLVTTFFYGTFVEAIGYNLSGAGGIGITDGAATNYFAGGFLTNATVNVDAARPINPGDLYWGGIDGPNWEVWNEVGDLGGFLSSPDRGTNQYWTPTDLIYYSAGAQGQWELAQAGLDDLPLTNGSWLGFSVAAGEYETNAAAPYNLHKHAPPSPDGTYVAYVPNTNDFAVQIVSTNNISTNSPYSDPAAALGSPTLKFLDAAAGGIVERAKIVEAPYGTAPDGAGILTEINNGGQITLKLGRPVYDDPNNPYGVDFIVFGNSWFEGTGSVTDGTDMDNFQMAGGVYGHPLTVSVSQDGVNWFTYSPTSSLFPDNAYRWDGPSHSWTDERLNPTKPLNPSVYATDFTGQTPAYALDEFIGSAGGTGYDLHSSGLPWIQYVRIEPGAGTYTVIDAVAAVNPTALGDALSITPDNLASGITNLVFQKPSDLSQTLLSINFHSVGQAARIETVALNDFTSFAPLPGTVSSACQITANSVGAGGPVALVADVGLRPGDNYTGNGGDLLLLQWTGTSWSSQPFSFNAATRQLVVSGLTNLSAFVVSQITPPRLSIQPILTGYAFGFIPAPNRPYILERSTDLAVWTPVATVTTTNTQPVTLEDNAAPSAKAFYRLKSTIP